MTYEDQHQGAVAEDTDHEDESKDDGDDVGFRPHTVRDVDELFPQAIDVVQT